MPEISCLLIAFVDPVAGPTFALRIEGLESLLAFLTFFLVLRQSPRDDIPPVKLASEARQFAEKSSLTGIGKWRFVSYAYALLVDKLRGMSSTMMLKQLSTPSREQGDTEPTFTDQRSAGRLAGD